MAGEDIATRTIGRKIPRYEDVASQQIAEYFGVSVSEIENLTHKLWHHLACSIGYKKASDERDRLRTAGRLGHKE